LDLDTQEKKFNVVYSGKLLNGFDIQQVASSIAPLFKLPIEDAKIFLRKRRVIKKRQLVAHAEQYKAKLENCGMHMELEEAQTIKPPIGLALEPIEGEETQTAPIEYQQNNSDTGKFETRLINPRANTIVCPKCNLEQEQAEQCSGCGVYIHKLLKKQEEQQNAPTDNKDHRPGLRASQVEIEDDGSDSIKLIAILGAAAVAFVGALVWSFIADTFNYEYALVAWGIGGAVGTAAAMLGSRGMPAGFICGMLTALSIYSGKVMMYQSFQDDLTSQFGSQNSEFHEQMKEAYRAEKRIANAYMNEQVITDSDIRDFMVEYEYTDQIRASRVSNDEVDEFREYTAPRLKEIAEEDISYEEWANFGLDQLSENLSVHDLIQEDFGIIDLLFLVLGVGTAFQISSGFGRQ